jgi:hypothetical protein
MLFPFLTVGGIETLDVRILVGLARLDVLDCHPSVLRPGGKRPAQELRPVIGPQDLGQAMLPPKLLEHADQALGRNRGVDLDMKDFAVEVVSDIERAKSLPGLQCI